MAVSSHVSKLKQGVDVWNQWRQDNWNIKPDLSGIDFTRESGIKRSGLWDNKTRSINMAGVNLAGVDLTESSLRGINLSGANLSDAFVNDADLRETNLTGADMHGAQMNNSQFVGATLRDAIMIDATLRESDFWQADLTGADLEGASLEQANFNRANLHGANLSRANLYEADLRDVNLRAANMDYAGVIGVKYDRRRMRGKYQGIRGVENCYGDAIYRRDALDQDYVDTLTFPWRRSPMIITMWLWRLIDYGRSLGRILWLALAVILGYGVAFTLYPDSISYAVNVDPLYAPYYASLVNFASFGLAEGVLSYDLTGQILVTSEIILGYLILGIFISVLLANIARRS